MATLNKRGNNWQLNWHDADGQHRVSLGAIPPKDARIALQRKKLELLTGARLAGGGTFGEFGTSTFGQFCVEYLAWYEQTYPSTFPRVEAIIRLHLARFWDVPLTGITAMMANRWAAERAKQVKPATVTREARVLKAVLNTARKWKVISASPLANWAAPPEREDKPPEFYTSEQLAALYLASGPTWAPVWQFMANTGLRRNEALNLQIKDVREDCIHVLSTNEAPTKSRKWREVPLNASARAAVKALRGDRTEGPLVPQVFPRSVTRAFDKAAKRAGLGGSLHTLRHTFVSHLVMANVNLPTVKRLAGHASINTTLRYAHLSPEYRNSAVDRIAL